ncbi:hypothetical protein KIL84_011119, partial [Mauremys mutica]
AFQETDPEKRSKNTTLLSLMFLVLAVISLVTHIIQGFMFGKSGEVLTKRLRSLSFKALLQQVPASFLGQSDRQQICSTPAM